MVMQVLVIDGPGSSVENNTSIKQDGGFLHVQSLEVLEVTNGGQLTANTALGGSGGAVAVVGSIGRITIDGGVVSGNTASKPGGAIFIGQDVLHDVHILNGASVENNHALTGGFLSVGRAVQGEILVRNGSRLCSCTAGVSGGAIFVEEAIFRGITVSSGATICQNSAKGNGGAIYAGFQISSMLVEERGMLSGNAAGESGGGVWAGGTISTADVTSGGQVIGNHAGTNGGALCASFIGMLTLQDQAVAVGNEAGGDGGLAFAERIISLTLKDINAASNKAGHSGGLVAVLTLPDSIALANSSLTGNVAMRGAGGVLSIDVPYPGSLLLSQVAPSGKATLTISAGTTVHGNGAYTAGGAISVAVQPSSRPTDAMSNEPYILFNVDISASTFSSNYAGGAGGAVSISSPVSGVLDSRISMRSCTFNSNKAGSSVYLFGSSVDGCYGGAISVSSLAKFKADAVMGAAGFAAVPTIQQQDSACLLLLEDVHLTNNSCEGVGGALAALSCPTIIRRSMFDGNTAHLRGGAVAGMVGPVPAGTAGTPVGEVKQRNRRQLAGEAGITGSESLDVWLDIANSTFTSNSAMLDCGGALYTEIAQGAGTRVVSTTFGGNTAKDLSGGGACITARGSNATALLHNVQLNNNTAAREGGGCYAALSSGPGNVLTLNSSTLSGNVATAGGAMLLSIVAGSRAVLVNTTLDENMAETQDGGAVHVQCARSWQQAAFSTGAACGSEPILTITKCNMTSNKARHGCGGALFVGSGVSATVAASRLQQNMAGAAGGAVAGAGCDSLTITDASQLTHGEAAHFGGGLFAYSCEHVLIERVFLLENRATTGAGMFLAGLSSDPLVSSIVGLEAVMPTTRQPLVIVQWTQISNNTAAKVAKGAANPNQPYMAAGYTRFSGHGGGVFVHGNVSVLLRNVDLTSGNSALVGAAVGSTQLCETAGAEQHWPLSAANLDKQVCYMLLLRADGACVGSGFLSSCPSSGVWAAARHKWNKHPICISQVRIVAACTPPCLYATTHASFMFELIMGS
ncbi:hypothetical protein TSOC_011896 [Tetrabaena socialis]|uniref:Uncharacterized protein n=1 Tax=Tetrabaena socialis TaxID=47790 RepID=A0A2J7ZPE2_9CHLO|nr:hypothetical protein TSOC_011896 [Tetrabaena socialis]|eukprot:PNH02147.1 hypothetical protein TSOC_011896 [Tetrabaena socialis]